MFYFFSIKIGRNGGFSTSRKRSISSRLIAKTIECYSFQYINNGFMEKINLSFLNSFFNELFSTEIKMDLLSTSHCDAISTEVLMWWIPFDSPWKALQISYSVRDDRTKCLSANSRKLTAGACAIFRYLHAFREFATEELLGSSWTQLTLNRAL